METIFFSFNIGVDIGKFSYFIGMHFKIQKVEASSHHWRLEFLDVQSEKKNGSNFLKISGTLRVLRILSIKAVYSMSSDHRTQDHSSRSCFPLDTHSVYLFTTYKFIPFLIALINLFFFLINFFLNKISP